MVPRKFFVLAGVSALSTVLLIFWSHSSWGSQAAGSSGSIGLSSNPEIPNAWYAPTPVPLAGTAPQELADTITLQPVESNSKCNPRVAPLPEQMQPLRWLFYQTQEDEHTRGDPFFIILYRGAETSPFIKESVHWGPGFPDYDDTTGLRENVKRRYGDEEYFDIIFFCGDRTGVIKDQVMISFAA